MPRALPRRRLYGLLNLLVLPSIGLICIGSNLVFAAQVGRENPPDPLDYSLTSLSGSYAFVGTYGDHVAANLGVVVFDGLGSAEGSILVNQPGVNGSREIVNVTVDATYSVNPNGTGTIEFVVTFPDGHTAEVTEDFVITVSERRGRTLLATSIFEAQQQPSVVISGTVFVVHTLTRLPDDPARRGYSQASLSGDYSVVGTYTGHVASVLGVMSFDGRGTFAGSAVANQPGPNGPRTIVNITLAGTYSVNADGTGTMSVTVTQPNGASSTVAEDFVITSAELRNRILLATSIVDAQRQASVILSAGDVFVSHTYSRRPD